MAQRAWQRPSRYRLDAARKTQGGTAAGYSEQTVCHTSLSACYSTVGFGVNPGCQSTAFAGACVGTPSASCGNPCNPATTAS